MKFGGTSVRDAASMKNVANIVQQSRSENPFVVISAIAQGTNFLERMGNAAALGDMAASEGTIQEFIARHRAIMDEGVVSSEHRNFLENLFLQTERELICLCEGIYLLKELSAKTLDKLYGYGEFLSSHCVATIFIESGIHAEWIDARSFMITDENFNAANPMMDVIKKKLAELLSKKEDDTVFVTQGFIGATADGCPTTMGRESSDFSAAILGAALHAEEVQIWTDVDGVFTADPNVVHRAKKIPFLSFEEALILSERGAKILHPKTIIPVMENNIPLFVRNSKKISDGGTKISSDEETLQHRMAISWMNNLILISLTPRRGMNYYLITELLAGIFAKNKITPVLQLSSRNSLQFVLSEKKSLYAFVQDCSSIGNIVILEKKALLSVVGKNVFATKRIISRVAEIADSIPSYLFSSDKLSMSLSVIVDDADIFSFAQQIHQEFFE
jgi:aspartate kinase